MAKVTSLFQLRGTIDELTFRKTEEGIIAGMKPGPRREKVLTHENFRRTRRNAAEFQLAIREARLMRHALGSALNGKTGSSLNGRMNGLFHKAAQQDRVSDLGSRRASLGAVHLLKGFDFNKQLSFDYALPVAYERSLDIDTGRGHVSIPSFIARKRKDFPPGATYFKIVSALVSVDYEQRNYRQDIQRSTLLPLRKKTPGAISFEHVVPVSAGAVVVQVLGMEFYGVDGDLLKGAGIRVAEVVRKEVGSRRSAVGKNTASGGKKLEAGKGNEATGGSQASREDEYGVGSQKSGVGRPEKESLPWEVVAVERMADFAFEEEAGGRKPEVRKRTDLEVERLKVMESDEAIGGNEPSREGKYGVGSRKSGVESPEAGVQKRKFDVRGRQSAWALDVRLPGLEFPKRVAETDGTQTFRGCFAVDENGLMNDEMAAGADWLAVNGLDLGKEVDMDAAVLSG